MRISVLLALALGGCTTTSADMLDDRTAIISGRSSAFVGYGSMTKETLVRAATEAKNRGFEYFAILDRRDASSTASFTGPSTTDFSGTANTNCMAVTCTTALNGSAITRPGQTTSFEKPGADLMVRFLKASEVPEGATGVWNADAILAAAPKKN